MDRELPASTQRKRRYRIVATIAAVCGGLAVGAWALNVAISPTLKRSKLQTAVAEIGRVEATVSATGVVVPEFEQAITSPIVTTIEKIYCHSGDTVTVGQRVLELDMQTLALSQQKLEDQLELQKARKQQLTLELERQTSELNSQYDIKELQVQFVQAQYDRVKHLFDLGGTTAEELSRAALDVEIAKRELTLLGEQIANQQAALQTDLNAVDLEVKIRQSELSETRRQVRLADARSRSNGVITWINDNIGTQVEPGQEIARIADLDSFKIVASISGIHADKLQVGGRVSVRIGERVLDGRISVVEPSIENNVMTFIVQLEDKGDPVLRPNLQADVFVVTSSTDNVLRVKNGPFHTGAVNQKVFVIEDDRAVVRDIRTGLSNYDWVELQGDIAPGELVVISNMREYQHMSSVSIDD